MRRYYFLQQLLSNWFDSVTKGFNDGVCVDGLILGAFTSTNMLSNSLFQVSNSSGVIFVQTTDSGYGSKIFVNLSQTNNSSMGKTSYKVRVDEYLFIIVIFARRILIEERRSNL